MLHMCRLLNFENQKLKRTQMNIVKKLLSSLLMMVAFSSLAQTDELKINYVVNNDQSVDFFYEKDLPGTHTVLLYFKSLSNASYSDFPRIAKGLSGKLLTLKPLNIERGISFSYGYAYVRGKINPKVDKKFTYLLPYKKGAKVRIKELGNINKMLFGRPLPKDWKAYEFMTVDTDTILSMRKGLVVEVIDHFPTDSVSYYTSKNNSISVEHSDGSIATYEGFDQSAALVKPGDKVMPHQPLGLIKKLTSKYSNNLRFMLFFLGDDQFSRGKRTLTNSVSMYEFITPSYLTSEGIQTLSPKTDYWVDVNEETITVEMTKKEKKKLRQGSK